MSDAAQLKFLASITGPGSWWPRTPFDGQLVHNFLDRAAARGVDMRPLQQLIDRQPKSYDDMVDKFNRYTQTSRLVCDAINALLDEPFVRRETNMHHGQINLVRIANKTEWSKPLEMHVLILTTQAWLFGRRSGPAAVAIQSAWRRRAARNAAALARLDPENLFDSEHGEARLRMTGAKRTADALVKPYAPARRQRTC
eukprot:TRINITY_DN4109_c0_g1_i1.p1 TRINITY_DN4109_c0_g1~~TRINITY_DN4109_c0_g1_i1.p1  ORF type:complete len:198 (-),score=25.86 TRINITY_DN4109_c0_g1_i1:406-999(-)